MRNQKLSCNVCLKYWNIIGHFFVFLINMKTSCWNLWEILHSFPNRIHCRIYSSQVSEFKYILLLFPGALRSTRSSTTNVETCFLTFWAITILNFGKRINLFVSSKSYLINIYWNILELISILLSYTGNCTYIYTYY